MNVMKSGEANGLGTKVFILLPPEHVDSEDDVRRLVLSMLEGLDVDLQFERGSRLKVDMYITKVQNHDETSILRRDQITAKLVEYRINLMLK